MSKISRLVRSPAQIQARRLRRAQFAPVPETRPTIAEITSRYTHRHDPDCPNNDQRSGRVESFTEMEFCCGVAATGLIGLFLHILCEVDLPPMTQAEMDTEYRAFQNFAF
jgi:hypothetical protein